MKSFRKIAWIIAIFTVLFSTILVVSCNSTKQAQDQSVKNVVLPADISVKTGTLSNGMDYYIKQNSMPKNRILLQLVLKVGSAMEEENQQGVAHFIEHMAFNGTKNFEKNDIISYFESIGMAFGDNLNAYTNFEQTVYQLEIPADDIEMLKTGMLILHDWASCTSFEQEELDKERGVILEEWRLTAQGLTGRFNDEVVSLLAKNSVLADRLPIGKMDIIQNITRDEVLEFYNKWYRPEFMSIVAVGDIEPDVIEEIINSTMSEIPASDKSVELPNFSVPKQEKKQVSILKDPEQKYSQVNLYFRIPDTAPVTTENDVKKNLIFNLLSQILNQRLSDITMTADAPWVAGVISGSNISTSTQYASLVAVAKENQFAESLFTLIDEYDRAINFGITQSELAITKKMFASSFEAQLANKDNIDSYGFINDIINHVLIGNTIVSVEDYYPIALRLLDEITLEEVNAYLQENFKNRGDIMSILANDAAEDIPPEEFLEAIWTQYVNEELIAVADEEYAEDFIERPATKAKITNKTDLTETGATEYVLENGVKIITKKTDFKKDYVIIFGTSFGGTNTLSDNDFPSSFIANDYMLLSGFEGIGYNELLKRLNAKNMYYVTYSDPIETEIYTEATAKEAEAMLQLINMVFTKRQFTDEAWQTLTNMCYEQGKQFGVSPYDAFNEKIVKTIYGNNIRKSMFDLNFFEKMNQKTAEKVINQFFENIADFTFTIVGDFDEESVIELCQYYLGSIPSGKKYTERTDINFGFPKGITTEVVNRGIDAQGYTYLVFSGTIPNKNNVEANRKDVVLLETISQLLQIRLREVIREDNGGSYGISVSPDINYAKNREFTLNVQFGCEPERAEDLINQAIATIKNLQTNGIDDTNLAKLQEQYKRTMEVNLMDNSWWSSFLAVAYAKGTCPAWVAYDYDKVLSWMTKENLNEALNKFINTNNYVCVFLKPEK